MMKLPEPQIESAPQLPRDPIIRSFRSQIAQGHEAGKRADQKLREAYLLKLNTARDVGLLLIQARGTLRENEFSAATDFLDLDAVKSYLRFARQHEEGPITDLAAGLRSIVIAMQSTGLLPYPGLGPQTLRPPNFFSHAITYAQQLAAAFKRYSTRKPLSDWRSDEIDALSAALAPVLRVYKILNAEIEKRKQ